MKTIFTEILLMFLFAASSYAQNDSIINLKKTDFSLYSMRKVIYESTGETIEKDLIDLENVSKLTFLRNDSLALYKHSEGVVYTKLSHINEVSKYKYRFSPVLGTTIGAVGGILLVLGAAWIVSGSSGSDYLHNSYNSDNSDNSHNQPDPWSDLNIGNAMAAFVVSIILGGVLGGYIGAVITDSINHDVLDLSSVPDKDKKTKLIKFLRHK